MSSKYDNILNEQCFFESNQTKNIPKWISSFFKRWMETELK